MHAARGACAGGHVSLRPPGRAAVRCCAVLRAAGAAERAALLLPRAAACPPRRFSEQLRRHPRGRGAHVRRQYLGRAGVHAVQRGACDAAVSDAPGGGEQSATASLCASARCPAGDNANSRAACVTCGAAAAAGAGVITSSGANRHFRALGDCCIAAGDAYGACACRAGEPAAVARADEAAAGIAITNASAGAACWRASRAACSSAAGAIGAAALAAIAEAAAAAG